MRYQKYSEEVINAVKRSKNPNLFPELKIPRSTAMYWIKNTQLKTKAGLNQSKYVRLKMENEILLDLISILINEIPLDCNISLPIKRKIVTSIESFSSLIIREYVLSKIGISMSKYYRIKNEVLGCKRHLDFCDSSRPNQLTKNEQKTLIQMATDKKYAHISTKSLCLLAQREGFLYCSYESWLKYLKLNQVQRPRVVAKSKKEYKIGIRAKHSNQIWHIDISEIQLSIGKFYLQVIIDNYSRLVVSYKISSSKQAVLTLVSLKTALAEYECPKKLMSDGGGENTAKAVMKVLQGKGINRVIAQSDTHFSNSMIESFFRKLKSSVNLKSIKTELGLRRKISWFIGVYNNKIPQAVLDGATPLEKYGNKFSVKEFNQLLNRKRLEIIVKRAQKYQECFKMD